MKIHLHKNARLTQFSVIPITCPDRKMAEIVTAMHKFPSNAAYAHYDAIQDYRKSGGFYELCFHSGAKLKCSQKKGEFYIYCYSSDGHDGLEAVNELKFWEAMRTANIRYSTHMKSEVMLSAKYDSH